MPDLLEGERAVVCDVERAGLRELPRLEVREVDLDRAGARIDVEIEVVLARDPRAWAWRVAAVLARVRPLGVDIFDRRVQLGTARELGARQPLERDRLYAAAVVACARAA